MKDEIKEIHNELENENKAPTMNNIREKLGLDRIENNNKDEVKEILDKLNNSAEHYILYDYEVKPLLDHITNLQEENEELREDNFAYHQLIKMQNQREYRSKFLKDFQKEHGKNVFPDYDEIYKRYDDYKTRIDKAIDKMKDIKYDLDIEPWSIYQVKGNVLFDLLNILQGEQNE